MLSTIPPLQKWIPKGLQQIHKEQIEAQRRSENPLRLSPTIQAIAGVPNTNGGFACLFALLLGFYIKRKWSRQTRHCILIITPSGQQRKESDPVGLPHSIVGLLEHK